MLYITLELDSVAYKSMDVWIRSIEDQLPACEVLGPWRIAGWWRRNQIDQTE
jgi:hypothetical protein